MNRYTNEPTTNIERLRIKPLFDCANEINFPQEVDYVSPEQRRIDDALTGFTVKNKAQDAVHISLNTLLIMASGIPLQYLIELLRYSLENLPESCPVTNLEILTMLRLHTTDGNCQVSSVGGRVILQTLQELMDLTPESLAVMMRKAFTHDDRKRLKELL